MNNSGSPLYIWIQQFFLIESSFWAHAVEILFLLFGMLLITIFTYIFHSIFIRPMFRQVDKEFDEPGGKYYDPKK